MRETTRTRTAAFSVSLSPPPPVRTRTLAPGLAAAVHRTPRAGDDHRPVARRPQPPLRAPLGARTRPPARPPPALAAGAGALPTRSDPFPRWPARRCSEFDLPDGRSYLCEALLPSGDGLWCPVGDISDLVVGHALFLTRTFSANGLLPDSGSIAVEQHVVPDPRGESPPVILGRRPSLLRVFRRTCSSVAVSLEIARWPLSRDRAQTRCTGRRAFRPAKKDQVGRSPLKSSRTYRSLKPHDHPPRTRWLWAIPASSR